MKFVNSIGLGIIGIGTMGANHARQILAGKVPGMHLAAVSDTDKGRLVSFPMVEFFPDWNDLLRSTKVDAVFIATPHFSHLPLGVAALQAGKHVLIEKPLTVQKSESEQILSMPRPPGQVFAIMLNQRTDPAFQKIRRMINDDEVGKIQRIQWTVTDWFRPRAYYTSGGWRATWAGEGGGVLVNQCPHNLDLYQWLFGMPKRITGFCSFGKYHDIEVEDEVTAYFEHEDGTTGVFVTSTGEAPGVNRLEVAGDRGRLVLENRRLVFHRNEVATSEFSRTTTEAFSRPTVQSVDIPLPDDAGEQHVGILKNFAATIRGEDDLIAPAEDGIKSVEIANAILMSSIVGKSVDLPIHSQDFSAVMENLIRHGRHS